MKTPITSVMLDLELIILGLNDFVIELAFKSCHHFIFRQFEVTQFVTRLINIFLFSFIMNNNFLGLNILQIILKCSLQYFTNSAMWPSLLN